MKITRKIILTLLGILGSFSLVSAATYDLQFGEAVTDCENNKFCTSLQIRGATGEGDFAIGSHTIFFNFNPDGLANPVYSSVNFDHLNLCIAGFASPYDTVRFSISPDEIVSEANLTTIMTSPNNGCPFITNDWITFGEVCFDIVSETTTGLSFNSGLTTINTNADNGNTHTQGTLMPLDIDLTCVITPVDTDEDGLTDAEEEELGTNPLVADSDEDGIDDGEEVNTYETNPLVADSDEDGLNDGTELGLNTNPLLADTDEDGVNDGDEVNIYTTNPLLADSDEDGLNDGLEINIHETNPLDSDSDNDGLNDGEEVELETDPNSEDSDEDGLTDSEEIALETDPNNEDSDEDGLTDSEEIALETDPNNEDSDEDGLTDSEEIALETDPNNEDSDEDGLTDGEEVALETDPNNEDSDEDGLTDSEEIALETDPNSEDSDNDGVPDSVEVGDANNPTNTDGDELINANDPDDDNDGIPTAEEDITADDDNDGIPDYLDETPLGTVVISGETLTLAVHPTPATTQITIQIKGTNQTIGDQVKIYDIQGQLVREITRKNFKQTNATSLNITDLAKGIYMISLYEKGQYVTQTRFVKY